jgi:uncharacterized protein (DUF2236 family)
MTVVTDLRLRMSRALFRQTAGADGDAARQRIHGTPGPRWFPAGSPIQEVHGDASMYIGGLRALLLQSLHPLAMAAVAEHSDYRGDPWGRLARTSTFLADTTFATAADAERAVEVVKAVHRHVHGTAPDGRTYRADDPHLLTWVHIAEVDSFLTAHDTYGQRRLSTAEADEYVAQTSHVARLLGAEAVPVDRAGLAAAIERYRPELTGGEQALEAAEFLLRRPPLSRPARVPYAVLSAAAVALLPDWAREPLGLAHRPVLQRTVARAGGHLVTAGLRWLVTAAPRPTP